MSIQEKPLMVIYNRKYTLDEITNALGNQRVPSIPILKDAVDNVQIHQWEGTNHCTVAVLTTRGHVCTVDTWVEPNAENLYRVLNGAFEMALKSAARSWLGAQINSLSDNCVL
ncbi:hypothetical protein pEaSNUABM6_00002 [Erwinia phage pEa_SNUABM_6]|nr:hypothetical protein pEaSNUABM6_00002 [Erwinia phage pEa_SNUABM_6]